MSYQSREIGDHAVIGFEFPDSRLGGRGSIVLLDRPEDQGARPGQTVRLYQSVEQYAGMFTKSELPSFKKFVAEAYPATIENTIDYIVNDASKFALVIEPAATKFASTRSHWIQDGGCVL